MRYEVYQDASGEWRWRYVASNGRILASSSEGYVRKDDCLECIDSMMESSGAPVREEVEPRRTS